ANMRLLTLAKPYPGSRLDRIESSGYRAPDSDYGPTIGYTTVAFYTLGGPVRIDAFVAHYVHELRGWRENATPIPCIAIVPPPGIGTGTVSAPRTCVGPLHIDFHRQTAHISIDI